MIDIFRTSFETTFGAIFQLVLIALAAGILTRKNIITEVQIKSFSSLTVMALLPCLTFSNIITNFHPSELKIWPLLPISAILMIGFGLLAAVILFRGQIADKKNLLAVASLQNAGYLILPLGKTLYPEQFDQFALYCFLYILGLSPILWSLGKYLISPNNGEKLSIGQLFSPPFFANILAVVLVFTKLRGFIPAIVLNPIDLVGSATVPVATFILGAVLGSISLHNIKSYLSDAAKVLSVKFVIVPLATIIVLRLSGLYENYGLICNLLVLQAAAAPATAIMIQAKHYGGDEDKLSSIFLLSYLACIVTIPLWIAVWSVMVS